MEQLTQQRILESNDYRATMDITFDQETGGISAIISDLVNSNNEVKISESNIWFQSGTSIKRPARFIKPIDMIIYCQDAKNLDQNRRFNFDNTLSEPTLTIFY